MLQWRWLERTFLFFMYLVFGILLKIVVLVCRTTLAGGSLTCTTQCNSSFPAFYFYTMASPSSLVNYTFYTRRVAPASTNMSPLRGLRHLAGFQIITIANIVFVYNICKPICRQPVCGFYFFTENSHGNNPGSAKALSQLL